MDAVELGLEVEGGLGPRGVEVVLEAVGIGGAKVEAKGLIEGEGPKVEGATHEDFL